MSVGPSGRVAILPEGETCSISLKRVAGESDILELYRGTPIAEL